MAYNPQMENDETLEEFVRILGRIKNLLGEETIPNDTGIDLVDAIEQFRQSGSDKDADELAELLERAEELKAQNKAKHTTMTINRATVALAARCRRTILVKR